LHPFRKILQFLADHCLRGGKDVTNQLLGQCGKILAMYEPVLAESPGMESFPAPADLPVEAARLRLFNCLDETLVKLSLISSLAILIDDLQWADDLSLGFLDYLARSSIMRQRPLVLIGTYRSEEVSPALEKIIALGEIDRLDLNRLHQTAVCAIVSDMLAISPPPQRFCHFLTIQSEGNPFFVAEYLRSAVEQGLVWRDDEGTWQVAGAGNGTPASGEFDRLALPKTLQDLLARRFCCLTEPARQLLQRAALLGREMPVEFLRGMSGLDEHLFWTLSVELIRASLLEETDRGALRFTHDKIREVAIAMIPDQHLSRLHLAAAQTIECVVQGARDDYLAELGHHWELAGEPEKARDYYLSGARRFRGRFAYHEAEVLFRSYFALVEFPTEESVTARTEFAFEVLAGQGFLDQALVEHEHALIAARSLGNRERETENLCRMGEITWRLGLIDRSKYYLESAVTIARESGETKFLGVALLRLAALPATSGDFVEAWKLYEAALAIARKTGDRWLEIVTLADLGYIRELQGNFEDSLQFHQASREIARTFGLRRLEGIEIQNLAKLNHLIGRIAESERLLEQAVQVFYEVHDRFSQGVNLLYHGIMARRKGDFDRAQVDLQTALTRLSEVGEAVNRTLTICELGHMELIHGRSARKFLQEASEVATSLNSGDSSEVGQAISRLKRAFEAFEAGESEKLFRGELFIDIPEGLRNRLLESAGTSSANEYATDRL
jgi:tetratricopeptide (TPR) repeat protein